MPDSTAASTPASDSSVGIMANPRNTVDRLLQSDDESRVRAVMRSLSAEQAAHLLQFAPTSRDKARLLAAMERRQRAETLDHVAPSLFATLVENKETGADYLLGEVSIDRFSELLAMCSPEQRFYWVSRAAAHDDGAAKLLTLLLPPKDLAEMLMTVPDFRRNFVGLRLYEPGQFESVPCRDPKLRAVLQFISDFDTELYKEVFLCARNLMDWEHVNREATEAFIEPAPLKEFEKFEAPDPEIMAGEPVSEGAAEEANLSAESFSAESTSVEEDGAPADAAALENALARADVSALATTALSQERLVEIQEDLDAMIQREIVDAGGSFAPEALEQASGRVHCYVHYGLTRLGAGAQSKMIRLLAERSLQSIMNAGMEYIEALRQRALRIAYLRDWYDKEQEQLLDGLIHPRVGINPGNRTEYVFRLTPRNLRKDERVAIRIDDARLHMDELTGWAALARHMPEEVIRRALASTPCGAQAFLGALAVAITLYRRWDPLFIDVQDVYDFRDRMVASSGDLIESAVEVLEATAERWATAEGMGEEEASRVAKSVVGAAERLGGWLIRTPRPKPPQCRNWVYLHDGR